MARRRGTRDEQRRREAEAEAAALRRTARAWFIRALLGIVAAALVSLLSVLIAIVLLLIALLCVGKGVTVSVDAVRVLESADPGGS